MRHALDGICGIEVGTFRIESPNGGEAPVSPLDALTVTRAIPPTLAAGTLANVTATLGNPTSQAISLDPCPSYGEFMVPLGVAPGAGTSTGVLNCGATSSIPANPSVTFSMQIAVPSITGTAKFGWTIPGTMLETGGAVDIVAGTP
ncbi:MAG TPA: hypothetical protein VFI30_02905 [Nocardioidaceae bacterium]|nr:hypothetical protein [Nocardioidaceae bacterium]